MKTDRYTESLENLVFGFVQWVIRLLGRVYLLFLAKIAVENRHNGRRPSKPLLIVSNHKSYYDPLVIAGTLPLLSRAYPMRFIAKDQLFKNPFLSFLFYLMGAFPAHYGQGLDKSLAQPKQILENGGTMFFFPEGKCIRDDTLGEPKKGAAVLVKEVPDINILPIAISGTYKIGHSGWFKRPRVKAVVGQPFRLKDKLPEADPDPEQIAGLLMEEIKRIYKP